MANSYPQIDISHVRDVLLGAKSDLDEDNQMIVVAVSGGADSMALLVTLHELIRAADESPLSDGRLVALTVDHGLRKESADEARQVSGWAANLGVEHHILTPDEPIAACGDEAKAIQQKARDCRYELMTGWCRNNGAEILCVAHHGDDQLETMLMRMSRGSGLAGLCAMDNISQRDGVKIVRPLLAFSKQQLVEYLEGRGQGWVEDPTNQKDDYTRNRIRKIAAQLEGEGFDAKTASAVNQKLRHADEAIEFYVRQWLNDNVAFQGGAAVMNRSVWGEDAAPFEIRRRALQYILYDVAYGGDGSGGISQKSKPYPIRDEKLNKLLKNLPNISKNSTLAGCLIRPRKKTGEIFIEKEHKNV